MAHRYPFPSRGVQRWTYVVQPGDSLASISKKLSGSAENWPGLVGANQHHVETEAVDGLDYEVIKLRENEHLFVPAGWGDDGYSHEDAGQLGEPLPLSSSTSGGYHSGQVYYDPMANFVKAIVALSAAVEGALSAMGWTRPVGPEGKPYTPQDIANVLIGMLPATGLPTTPNTWDANTLQVLYRQAAALLAHAQLPPGSTDIFRSIPWTTVPWNTFPWANVTAVATDPAQQAQVWRFLIGSLQNAGQYNSSGPQDQSYNVPDFKTIDWTTSPGIGDVPWGKIPWDKIDPAVFSHPRVQQCLADADAITRMADMMAHSDCFVGKGGDFFADYLCKQDDGTYKDLADCKGTTPELPENPPCPSPAVWEPAVKACVIPGAPPRQPPAWVNTVDWSCQPSPDCIYTQLQQQVPAAQRCPPPGTAWPGCVPQWLAQYGIAVPEPKEQEKPKTTSYMPVVVALGALSTVLLVGGVIAMRNRES